MKSSKIAAWALTASMVVGGAGVATCQTEAEGAGPAEQPETIIEQWHEGPQQKAREFMERYGQPDEFTANRLVWHNNDWWKRTEIVNEEVPHNFPEEHHDFLYQTVDYKVPPEMATEVVALSGSLIIDRTKGELTSRCDSEEHNLLALNLAHQVVEGQHTAHSARDVFAQARLEGEHGDLMERLTFSPERLSPEPADPGVVYGARPEDEEEHEEEDPRDRPL